MQWGWSTQTSQFATVVNLPVAYTNTYYIPICNAVLEDEDSTNVPDGYPYHHTTVSQFLFRSRNNANTVWHTIATLYLKLD